MFCKSKINNYIVFNLCGSRPCFQLHHTFRYWLNSYIGKNIFILRFSEGHSFDLFYLHFILCIRFGPLRYTLNQKADGVHAFVFNKHIDSSTFHRPHVSHVLSLIQGVPFLSVCVCVCMCCLATRGHSHWLLWMTTPPLTSMACLTPRSSEWIQTQKDTLQSHSKNVEQATVSSTTDTLGSPISSKQNTPRFVS